MRRVGLVVLVLWTVATLALSFALAGASAETTTRLLVLAYLAGSLIAYARWRPTRPVAHPHRWFIGLSLVGAAWCELAHLISRPLDPSLLVTADSSTEAILRAAAIDLTLTVPAYLVILSVIWRLARRYQYSPLSYLFVIGLGQSLGDGMGFFLAAPAMLLLAPYVMTNYWAMSFVPYLLVTDALPQRRPATWWAHLAPIVILPAVYFLIAAILFTVGRALGLLPTS